MNLTLITRGSDLPAFGVVKDDGRLHVPNALGNLLDSLGLLTAEQWLAYARANPSYIARCLGRTAEEVRQAVDFLALQLRVSSRASAPRAFPLGVLPEAERAR